MAPYGVRIAYDERPPSHMPFAMVMWAVAGHVGRGQRVLGVSCSRMRAYGGATHVRVHRRHQPPQRRGARTTGCKRPRRRSASRTRRRDKDHDPFVAVRRRLEQTCIRTTTPPAAHCKRPHEFCARAQNYTPSDRILGEKAPISGAVSRSRTQRHAARGRRGRHVGPRSATLRGSGWKIVIPRSIRRKRSVQKSWRWATAEGRVHAGAGDDTTQRVVRRGHDLLGVTRRSIPTAPVVGWARRCRVER